MKVLVTGGAGFIGSVVARGLRDRGDEVVVLDAMLPAAHGAAATAPQGTVVADVRDPDAMDAALTGVDAVCHQAAMVGLGTGFADAPDYVSCNDHGTAVLLAAMARAGVGHLVLASSMVVYGEGRFRCPEHGEVRPGPRLRTDLDEGRYEPPCPVCGLPLEPALVTEDAPTDPRNVYAATKLAQEHLASSWARVTGGTVTALRYHNVYGPGMPRDTPYAGVASLFRSALARGEAPRVFEDGAQRRDFVHVEDVAQANLLSLARPGDAGVLRTFNVGSDVVHTIGDLATTLATACDGPAPVVTGDYRLGDVRHITASSARLRAGLGYAPAVSFEAGVADFAAASLRS